MARLFQWSFRAKYADTDMMQVVYHGRYFEYFEAARNELLRELDYPYTKLEAERIMLPVVEAHVYYKRSARYDDLLDVRSVILSFEHIRLTIGYEVFRLSEGQDKTYSEKLTEGSTVHVFMHSETRKVTRPPEVLVSKIRACL